RLGLSLLSQTTVSGTETDEAKMFFWALTDPWPRLAPTTIAPEVEVAVAVKPRKLLAPRLPWAPPPRSMPDAEPFRPGVRLLPMVLVWKAFPSTGAWRMLPGAPGARASPGPLPPVSMRLAETSTLVVAPAAPAATEIPVVPEGPVRVMAFPPRVRN